MKTLVSELEEEDREEVAKIKQLWHFKGVGVYVDRESKTTMLFLMN